MRIRVKLPEFVLLRIKKGLSQRTLARQVGISSAFMSQLENGRRNPSPAVARRLSLALEASFDSLFEIEVPTNEEDGR